MYQFTLLLLFFLAIAHAFLTYTGYTKMTKRTVEGISGGAEAQMTSNQGPNSFILGSGEPLPINAPVVASYSSASLASSSGSQLTGETTAQQAITGIPYERGSFAQDYRNPYYAQSNDGFPHQQTTYYTSYYPRRSDPVPQVTSYTPLVKQQPRLRYPTFWYWLEDLFVF